eukprot:GHVL01039870.1.p2 GENE.GHVL01039870.1~~GHVL01039870.1.p2  ORF type:complete len:305 (-),score=60.44 GHVL01039870.1:184-1098(-)
MTDCVNLKLFWSEIFTRQTPVVYRNLDIGSCVEKWTPDYINSKIGEEYASIHICDNPYFNFKKHNFKYELMRMSDFIEIAKKTNKKSKKFYYFRQLGKNHFKDRSFLSDYSDLNSDFQIPSDLKPNSEFSSILRIASKGTSVWAHYDVPDNFLVQVRGKKEVILLPPSQVSNMYIGIDDSSSPVNLFEDLTEYPKAQEAMKYAIRVTMESGDLLFIPALWIHTTRAIDEGQSDDLCLSINIFFLNSQLLHIYDKKDIYGNKDPKVIQNAIKNYKNFVISPIQQLPEPFCTFYLNKIQGSTMNDL